MNVVLHDGGPAVIRVEFNITLVAIWDAHVKDMGKAVCGSSSSERLTQEVTSDMKFTDSRWSRQMGQTDKETLAMKVFLGNSSKLSWEQPWTEMENWKNILAIKWA